MREALLESSGTRAFACRRCATAWHPTNGRRYGTRRCEVPHPAAARNGVGHPPFSGPRRPLLGCPFVPRRAEPRRGTGRRGDPPQCPSGIPPSDLSWRRDLTWRLGARGDRRSPQSTTCRFPRCERVRQSSSRGHQCDPRPFGGSNRPGLRARHKGPRSEARPAARWPPRKHRRILCQLTVALRPHRAFEAPVPACISPLAGPSYSRTYPRTSLSSSMVHPRCRKPWNSVVDFSQRMHRRRKC